MFPSLAPIYHNALYIQGEILFAGRIVSHCIRKVFGYLRSTYFPMPYFQKMNWIVKKLHQLHGKRNQKF